MSDTADKKNRDEVLEGIFNDLAKALKNGVTYVDPETGQPQASLLNVARQFLKDNKFEGKPVQGTPLGDLSDLPVFEDLHQNDGLHGPH